MAEYIEREKAIAVIEERARLGMISGFNARGDMFCDKNPLRWRKTGRHFPELPALLKKMKEVESNDS